MERQSEKNTIVSLIMVLLIQWYHCIFLSRLFLFNISQSFQISIFLCVCNLLIVASRNMHNKVSVSNDCYLSTPISGNYILHYEKKNPEEMHWNIWDRVLWLKRLILHLQTLPSHIGPDWFMSWLLHLRSGSLGKQCRMS